MTNIESNVFGLLKRIVVWVGVIVLFYVMPFSIHLRIGREDGRGQLEFTLGKSENSIKVGTEY
jgi:hypothetical protein